MRIVGKIYVTARRKPKDQKKTVVPNGHENRGATARGRRSSFPDCDGPLVYL